MSKDIPEAIQRLCERLDVDPHVLVVCLEESVVEIAEVNGQLDLQNGTVLRLRRLQRICYVFDVDIYAALLLEE